MSSNDRYIEFCKNWKCDDPENEVALLFESLQNLFDVSPAGAMDIWYAPQRSWYVPEMMDVIIDMDKNPQKYDFIPVLTSGDFDWDQVNKKFVKAE